MREDGGRKTRNPRPLRPAEILGGNAWPPGGFASREGRVKSLPPPPSSGELPTPSLSPLPSPCSGQRKVPVCPQSLKPRGRGDAFQKDKISLNSTRQTYRRRHIHTQRRTTVLSHSASDSRFPAEPRIAGSRAKPGSGAARRPPAPRALGACGLGRPRSRKEARPSLRGRSLLHLHPHGAPGSEGHDGCAPGVNVSQHRLIAADLPGLSGFRAALRGLLLLPAAPGAFP